MQPGDSRLYISASNSLICFLLDLTLMSRISVSESEFTWYEGSFGFCSFGLFFVKTLKSRMSIFHLFTYGIKNSGQESLRDGVSNNGGLSVVFCDGWDSIFFSLSQFGGVPQAVVATAFSQFQKKRVMLFSIAFLGGGWRNHLTLLGTWLSWDSFEDV